MATSEFGGNSAAHFFPWHSFGFAGVKLIDAASSLLVPGLFAVFIDCGGKALNE